MLFTNSQRISYPEFIKAEKQEVVLYNQHGNQKLMYICINNATIKNGASPYNNQLSLTKIRQLE